MQDPSTGVPGRIRKDASAGRIRADHRKKLFKLIIPAYIDNTAHVIYILQNLKIKKTKRRQRGPPGKGEHEESGLSQDTERKEDGEVPDGLRR